MKTIRIDLERTYNHIEIVPIADAHIGDPLCDMELLKREIEYVRNNDNAYAILNGDLMNNAIKTSVSDIYSERLSPMQQLELATNLLRPIAHKILCVTSGNHEDRTYKTDGIDLTRLLCRELGLEHRYSNASALLFVRFGELRQTETNGSGKNRKVCYTVYVTHGSGGGGKTGSKANRASELASIIDSDIYVTSHFHTPIAFKESYHRTDVRNSTVSVVDKLFVVTSSFLNYGGYGEKFGFRPSSKDNPHIFLDGTRKYFTASV